MGIKIGSNNIGDVYVGNSKIGSIYVGNNLVYSAEEPIPYQDFILNVARVTRNTYTSSTTYNNDSFIGLIVYAKSGGTTTVTYDGVTQTLTAGSNTIIYGKYKGVDDGTASSGTLTISGDYTKVQSLSTETAKNTSSYVPCITGIVQMFGGQITDISYLFAGQTSITGTITLHNGIKTIGDYAFNNTRINTIIAPNVTKIGAYAFQDDTSLRNCNFSENGLTEIGTYAFAGTGRITELILAKNIYMYGAFGSSLNNVYSHGYVYKVIYKGTINDWLAIEHYASGVLSSPFGDPYYGTKGYLWINNEQITSFTIPNGTTRINNGTFAGMQFITSLTIPNSVTTLGSGAFAHAEYAQINNIITNNITTIESNCFYGYNNGVAITIPSSVTSIGQNAFNYCRNVPIINFLHPDITILATVGTNAFTNGLATVAYAFVDTQANVEAWQYWTTTYFTNTTYNAYTP